MSEDIFRIGSYIGVLLGLGYGAAFGTGWHTGFLAVLCVGCILFCARRLNEVRHDQ